MLVIPSCALEGKARCASFFLVAQHEDNTFVFRHSDFKNHVSESQCCLLCCLQLSKSNTLSLTFTPFAGNQHITMQTVCLPSSYLSISTILATKSSKSKLNPSDLHHPSRPKMPRLTTPLIPIFLLNLAVLIINNSRIVNDLFRFLDFSEFACMITRIIWAMLHPPFTRQDSTTTYLVPIAWDLRSVWY